MSGKSARKNEGAEEAEKVGFHEFAGRLAAAMPSSRPPHIVSIIRYEPMFYNACGFPPLPVRGKVECKLSRRIDRRAIRRGGAENGLPLLNGPMGAKGPGWERRVRPTALLTQSRIAGILRRDLVRNCD